MDASMPPFFPEAADLISDSGVGRSAGVVLFRRHGDPASTGGRGPGEADGRPERLAGELQIGRHKPRVAFAFG
jgi:hypothetical protein